MIDLLYYWWAVGFSTCLAAGTYLNRDFLSFKDFLMIFGASAVLGLAGPVLTFFIVRWFYEAWRDSLAIDEEGKRDWPWRKYDE